MYRKIGCTTLLYIFNMCLPGFRKIGGLGTGSFDTPQEREKHVKTHNFVMFIMGAVLTTALASAQNPHFIRADSDINSAGTLLCSFKAAGYGSGDTVNATCSAQAMAL